MADPSPTSYVIVIAGSVGSGKSTLAAALARALGDAPLLNFDHYGEYVEWPSDMAQWMASGADPSHIRVLLALRRGQAVSDPLDGRLISPARTIILEEPSGRERAELRPYIDLVVYLDVPPDICVLRMLERSLDLSPWRSQGTFAGEPTASLVRQLDSVALWLEQYRRARPMYLSVSRRVKEGADVIVDGMRGVAEVVGEVVRRIQEKQEAGIYQQVQKNH
jgi:thymidylate kinase